MNGSNHAAPVREGQSPIERIFKVKFPPQISPAGVRSIAASESPVTKIDDFGPHSCLSPPEGEHEVKLTTQKRRAKIGRLEARIHIGVTGAKFS